MPVPDLSEFEAIADNKPSQCVVARARERLSDEDREKFDAALAAEHIGHLTISKWLRARDLRAGDEAVRRHRRSECACA